MMNNISKMFEEMRPYVVYLPVEYIENKYEGDLYGYYIPETKTFNIIYDKIVDKFKDAKLLGFNIDKNDNNEYIENSIYYRWVNDEIKLEVNTDEAILKTYSIEDDIFSRNQGIIDKCQMRSKQAIILGLGSGGGVVAIELAKTGIGSIILCDDDIVEYHNIARHVCNIKDVGKYKVDIIAEYIHSINPNCEVIKFRQYIEHVDPDALKAAIWKDSILLCCADNRHAAYITNELSDLYKIPMVSAGCGTMASTGEVFYYKPDSGMPCYECAFGADKGVDYNDDPVRRRFYTSEYELEKMDFQPGLSLDIKPTTIFQSKLAIDLLLEDCQDYTPKLLPYIKQVTVIYNFLVDENIDSHMTYKYKKPMSWVGCNVKRTHCDKRGR